MNHRIWLALGLPLALAGCHGPTTTGSNLAGGVPTAVELPMPASLSQVAPLSQTAAFRVLATSGGTSFATDARTFVGIYVQVGKLIAQLLGDVASAQANGRLQTGTSYTFTSGGTTYTVLLRTENGKNVLSIGQGTSATGADQLCGISYTSAQQGVAVFRLDTSSGNLAYATTFDLTAGKATADLFDDASTASNQVMRIHEDFTSTPTATPSFAMQVYANSQTLNDPNASGVIVMSSAFLPDGSGASLIGASTGATATATNATVGTQNAFQFLPDDGQTFLSGPYNESTPHAFFMGADATDIAYGAEGATLDAIVPADTSVDFSQFPGDPTQENLATDTTFTFPQ